MMAPSESHLADLIRLGILNLEDLEANRSGDLAENQKRMLYLNLAVWLGIAITELVVLMAFIYFQVFTRGDFTVAVLGIGLLISLTYICLKEAKPFWEDIKNDTPRSISGRLQKHFSTVPGSTKGSTIAFCSIRVGDQVFSVSSLVYDHVINEESYRVYFVSHTRKVINIEPL